jgi:hypothetical protein
MKCIGINFLGLILSFSLIALVARGKVLGGNGPVTAIHHGHRCQIEETSCFVFRSGNSSKNGDLLSNYTPWFAPVSRTSLMSNSKSSNKNPVGDIDRSELTEESKENDTIRVRIWKALVATKGQEVSLKKLGAMVGERNIGDLRSHLTHVERQAKTFGNKSDEWKQRRGLMVDSGDGTTSPTQKVKLKSRRGDRGLTFIRLQI